MKLFSTLMEKIFGANKPALDVGATPVGGAAAASVASEIPSTPSVPAVAAIDPVDVTKLLDGLAAAHAEKLDWRRSIVDLMKLVGMDSSLSDRKELATELGYEGDMTDSAKMNMWLHKEVLRKLAENGGKVPAELLD
jgi:hypothetical protein